MTDDTAGPPGERRTNGDAGDAGNGGGAEDPQAWWSRPGSDAWSGPERSAGTSGSAWPPAQDNPSGYPPEQGYPGEQRYPQEQGYPLAPYPGAAPSDFDGRGPRRRGPSLGALIGVGLAIALLAGSLGGALGLLAASQREDRTTTQPVEGVSLGAAPQGDVDRAPDSVAGVAGTVLPSVVSIVVQGGGQQGTGSGFVLTEDGFLLTNNHVVAAAGEGGGIEVSFGDGEQAEAEIVGRDSGYDLAVLKIDARNLTPLPLGSSEDVQVGDPVIAVGSPLGLVGTVTSGIISAKERPVTAGGSVGDASYINALQTDAAINPGNSGGPLVNLDGEVVGVNSAIASLGGSPGGPGSPGIAGSIGLGFAIPIDQARRTAEQIIRTGEAVRPFIGANLDPRFPGQGALILAEPTENGALPLVPGGPAELAGLQAGDIIIAIDGDRVRGSNEVIVDIRSRVPGDEVTITVLRDGQEIDLPVVVGEAPG
jgi:putative serine protease PepD